MARNHNLILICSICGSDIPNRVIYRTNAICIVCKEKEMKEKSKKRKPEILKKRKDVYLKRIDDIDKKLKELEEHEED